MTPSPTVSAQTSSSLPPLKLAIAGLGTVGACVVSIVQKNGEILARRTGREIEIVAVSARDRRRDRGVDLSGIDWTDDPVSLARRPDVDVIIELIGGSDGPAYALTKEGLAHGKAVVTANKAMMAHHGAELAALAEEKGVSLRYEAAVAGGIPLIKALREGLTANRIRRVSGILNGTCNYILSEMEQKGSAYADALRDAQELGYAEADPTFDVNGMDTAHKTVLLAALAFGIVPPLDRIEVEGIEAIAPVDVDYARELGFCIKLLGVAEQFDDSDGVPLVRVNPAMVRMDSPLAPIHGPTNAVLIEADEVGQIMLLGPGAGGAATASAVLGDVCDIARGAGGPVFNEPGSSLREGDKNTVGEQHGTYYIRLRVEDRPGVMAEVARVLADLGVSIESLLQRGRAPVNGVYIVLTTHKVAYTKMNEAVKRLNQSTSVIETPTLIRVENGVR